MIHISKRGLGCLLFIAASTLLQAQQISFHAQTASLRNDTLHIGLQMNIHTLFVDADQAVIFTPVLKRGRQLLDLPPVIVCGKKWQRLFSRESSLQEGNRMQPYVVELRDKQTPTQSVDYKVAVPYALWMKEAVLCLRKEYRDYRKRQYLSFDTIMPTLQRHEKPIATEPSPVAPATEVPLLPTAKHQAPPTEIRIDYCGGRYDVLPSNKQLLALNIADNRQEIKEISIIGYASPEGDYRQNEQLAQQRAENLRRYICRTYGITPLKVRTAWVAEDWQGLSNLLLQSNKPYRQGVLRILSQYGVFGGREKQLMDYKGGVPYKEMLEEWFPALRYAILLITYKEYTPQ